MPSGTVGSFSTSHMWRRSTYREENGKSVGVTPYLSTWTCSSCSHDAYTQVTTGSVLCTTMHAKEAETMGRDTCNHAQPKGQEMGCLAKTQRKPRSGLSENVAAGLRDPARGFTHPANNSYRSTPQDSQHDFKVFCLSFEMKFPSQ